MEASATARRILRMREDHRDLIANQLGRMAGKGHKVLEHLFVHPIISVNDVRGLVGTTHPAASDLVDRMQQIGLLAEMTGRARNRRYRYDQYVSVFADD